jgi:hypothetical protein
LNPDFTVRRVEGRNPGVVKTHMQPQSLAANDSSSPLR